MSTLSTQVITRGTQILEYSMQYCLKYLDLEYFLVVKGLGSPKFPCMSHTPPSEKHVPMLSEVIAGMQDRKTGTGLLIRMLGRHRQDVQQNTANGGFTPTPFGCFPNARVNQYGHLAHTALQFYIFLLFQHITMVYYNHITIHHHISHITSYSL